MRKLNGEGGRLLTILFSLLVLYALIAALATQSFSTLFPALGTY